MTVTLKYRRRTLMATAIASVAIAPHSPCAWAADEETNLRTVVSTAHRAETRLEDVPQRMEIIDRQDIEYTINADLTDLLKKMPASTSSNIRARYRASACAVFGPSTAASIGTPPC